MIGETNLKKLLAGLSPVLRDGEYVFITAESARYGDYAETDPVASVMEPEGLTLVLEKKTAEKAGFAYNSIFACITLQVHSSLDAVGLTAAVSELLSLHGISANIIAGFFHDHVFVPSGKASAALALLTDMAAV